MGANTTIFPHFLVLVLLFPLLSPTTSATVVDLGQGEFESIYDVAISPNSTWLAQGRIDGWVEIWDIDTSELVIRFQAHSSLTGAVAWSPNGSHLATGGENDRYVRVWDTQSWQLLQAFQRANDKITSVHFSPNGSLLVVGAHGIRSTMVWDTSDWSEIYMGSVAGTSLYAEFSPDGAILAVINSSWSIMILDTQTWTPLTNISLSTQPFGIDFSPNGQWLAVDLSVDSVSIYSTSNWTLSETLTGASYDVSFSADSSILAIGSSSSDGVVSLWNTANWSFVENRSNTGCNGWSIDSSMDGEVLVVSSCSNARVWVADNDSDGFRNSRDDCPVVWGNSTIGLKGCVDLDGDGRPDSIDDFPTDPTQWQDSDGDGYGDNPGGTDPDVCPSEWGNSTNPGLGCPDQDGDGWADQNDSFPSDPQEWQDSDGDSIGDNADDCPFQSGSSIYGSIGCIDGDGDGWPDSDDSFPNDPNEWSDVDSDGVGDNADQCPSQAGTSTQDRVGCPDQDQDGWSDQGDRFPSDPNEWVDSDVDGIGDNADGCPLEAGNSTRPDIGCPDTDQDGWSDANDSCPLVPGNSTEPGPGCPDLDHDGIDDAQDPFLNDTDNDGLPNQWEEDHGLLNGSDDALGDPDGDGRTNIDEYYAGTDPNLFDKEPEGNVTPDPSSEGGNQPLVDPVDAGGFIVSAILAIAGAAWVIIRRRKMPRYLKMISLAEDTDELGSVWDEIKRKLDKGRILAQHGVVLKEAVDGHREHIEALWDEWDDPDIEAPPEPDWFYENPGW